MTPVSVALIAGLGILAAVFGAGFTFVLMRGQGQTGGGIVLPKNWKTSTASVVTAFFAFVMFSPEDFSQWPWVLHLAKFMTIGGLASIGLLSRDFNSHSTVQETQTATVEAANEPPKGMAK